MSRRIRFSIKLKFALLAAVIVAISSTVWGTWAWRNEKRLLYEKLEGEGRAMMRSLTTPIINALLYEEMGVIEEGGLLDNFVEEIMANRSFRATYAYVTDHEGRVLAHNRYVYYGKKYDDPLTLSALASADCVSTVSGTVDTGAQVLEMGVPLRIHGKVWGALRVGISTEPLAAELRELLRRIVTFSVVFFVAGTAVFYFVGASLAKPLRRLATVMGDIGSDSFAADVPEKRNDEIGLLQESFFDMLHRLEKNEEERRKTLAHLIHTEKLVTVGKLVAGVAHEVNNPVSAMTACIHNLEANPADFARYTEILKKGLSRIETIVRDLSHFSRAGEIAAERIASDAFFHETVTFAELAMKKRNVLLRTVDSCIPPVMLEIDRGKLHQVILNLLFNAADASPPGGTVELRCHAGEDCYCISVIDEGSGVPAEERENIFEIFYTTKAPGKGSGMGLAISRSIVEMHRGSISVESAGGKTVFMVKIPLPCKVIT